ncbi:MAG: hypothetical protein GYB33_07845 [Gammaproteobacteria bacterium]|nr:hypothetical protein [Gammaproteobacteria bacterium]
MNKIFFAKSRPMELQEKQAVKASVIHLNLFRQALKSLQFGSLALTWPNGEITYHKGNHDGVHAEMTL